MGVTDTFIQYGVLREWAQNYAALDLSISSFKTLSKKILREKFYIAAEQIDQAKKLIKRAPIDADVAEQLLRNSRYVCCLCRGEKSDSYIIHHIVDYAISQDNSYANLAVLCPNDHDLVHRKGVSLTQRISEEQLYEASTLGKREWKTLI